MACLYGGPPFVFVLPILLKSVIGSFAPQPLHSFSSRVSSTVSVGASPDPDAPWLEGMVGDGGCDIAKMPEESRESLFLPLLPAVFRPTERALNP
jgi:hypothetical protein